MASDALLTVSEMNAWLPGNPAPLDDVFALTVIDAASLVVRDAGSSDWTAVTVPPQAKLIATLLAKNYFSNPDQLISETTDVITERRVDDVVRGMTLTEAEQVKLAELAAKSPPAGLGGGQLHILQTTRGPMETPLAVDYVTDTELQSDWMIPWRNQGLIT